MNIYLITEDGETFAIRAKTMVEALTICEDGYIDSLDLDNETGEKIERKYYYDEILQSCVLIGDLRN